MRIVLAAAAILLAIAGCGERGGGNDQNRTGLPTPGARPGTSGSTDLASDQSFRQSYRTINIATCLSAAQREGGAAVAGVDFRPYCTCFIDRSMEGLSVEQLSRLSPGPREARIADQCAREHRLGEDPAAPGASGGEAAGGNASGGK